jgi:RNA-directed DNA polymerase
MDILKNLSSDLKSGRFKFKPARRVIIPKPGGGERPLTIPSAIDKVVLQAIHMVLEPL